MKWPPNKSWTSTTLRKGFRHFVSINYYEKNHCRWVTLVSVLDGNARLRVSWEELNDARKWLSGWVKLNRDELNKPYGSNDSSEIDEEVDSSLCLHPSRDSGLNIPSTSSNVRPWFSDD